MKCFKCRAVFADKQFLRKHEQKHRMASARSENARKAANHKRQYEVTMVKTPQPKLVTFSADDVEKLEVDRDYQRKELPGEIARNIQILRSGYTLPAPPSIVIRRNEEKFVVDGQQRWAAYRQCRLPMQALVYDLSSFDVETERKLWVILNSHVRVGPQWRIHGSDKISAAMIRELNSKPNSPYQGCVNLGEGRGRRYDASVLLAGMSAAMSGRYAGQSVDTSLAKADFLLKQPENMDRAAAFFALLPVSYPAGQRVKQMHAVALGIVAHERWIDANRCYHPRASILRNLSRLNWYELAPSTDYKYLPTVIAAIRRRWPERGGD